jgi:hypothetical protein
MHVIAYDPSVSARSWPSIALALALSACTPLRPLDPD